MAMVLLLMLSLVGGTQAVPFHIGEIWRGHVSSCIGVHKHSMDLVVDKIKDNTVTVLFNERTLGLEMEMSGTYSDETGQLYLRVIEYDEEMFESHNWAPCDADGYISLDGTTYTGQVICDWYCDEGAGEFMVQHDRTQFKVAGAGDLSVVGLYESTSDEAVGVPTYHQVNCPEVAPRNAILRESMVGPVMECEHVMRYEQVGAFFFWTISHAQFPDEIKYRAWSDSVTPPYHGWRVIEPGQREAAADAEAAAQAEHDGEGPPRSRPGSDVAPNALDGDLEGGGVDGVAFKPPSQSLLLFRLASPAPVVVPAASSGNHHPHAHFTRHAEDFQLDLVFPMLAILVLVVGGLFYRTFRQLVAVKNKGVVRGKKKRRDGGQV